jgi:hypothetical protein
MSELTVIEFESSTFGNSYVSELSDGAPYTVHGVALGAGDVTVGQSGIKKKWPADELQNAAQTLKGTNLVVDHENDATGVVGRVTKAGYKEGTGVVYEAELYDDDLAQKVKNGLLEVSIRGYHADVDSLEEEEETGAKVVEDVEFDNLSIVPTGAAPSNTLEMGEHAELSVAALKQFTGTLNAAELAEIEPGMWVTTGDTNGITVSQIQDGEVEVDIYEESDGKWRSTGETKMMDTDSLDEWDVDEEEDIGAVEEDEEDSDEEENAPILEAGIKFFDTVNDSMHTIASIDGDMVTIEGEDGSMWKESKEDIFEKIAQGEWEKAGHDEMAAIDDKVTWDNGAAQGIVRERKTDGCFNEKIDGDVEVCASEDEAVVLIEIVKDGEATGTMVAHMEETVNSADFEMAAASLEPSDGDFVTWKGVNDEPQFGQVVSMVQDGQQMMAEIRRFTESGDPLDEIVQKPAQGLERWDRMNEEEDMPDDMRDDAPSMEAPSWEEGQMVKWQVNPAMKGKIVHVDRDKKIIMVEVMEDTEQGPQSSGFTVTAGYSDLVPMDEESAAVSTRDVPTQDSEPTHDTGSVKGLLERFIDENSTQPSLEAFADWLDAENLAIDEGEGEEEILDTQAKRDNSHEEQPHRYIDADDEQESLAEGYDDYPEAAKENAQMALDAKEETDNPNDCGTDVGWKRAKQLANGESVTRKQLGKMSAFNRHRSNSDMDDEEGKADCGWMMWKAWGGDEGVDWAQDKLDSIEEENAMYDVDEEHMFTERGEAEDMADELDLDGVHEMDGMWMPGDTHEEYMDAVASTSKHSDDEEDESKMEGSDYEGVLEMVGSYLDEDGNGSGDDVADFIEWAGDEMVDDVIDEFMSAEDENYSEESPVGTLQTWLANIEEASANEGDNASDAEEELEDYEMHTPDWSGTTESDWSSPDLEDFETDDLGEVANHFLISLSGFPPDNFGDLKLPVVEPNGELNVNALAAVKGGRGVSAVEGLSDDMEQKIIDWVNETANDPELFDRSWGEEEEENARADAYDSDTAGRPTPGENTVGGVRVLSGDDLRYGSNSEESDVDSLEIYTTTTMTSEIEEKLADLDNPVAVEQDEVEELRDKADRFEEMSETLASLKERTDILDEVDREQVEELADADDPVVEESTRYEELQDEAEQVKGVYAAQLAEHYEAFDAEELTDKFSIEELREKFEEQFGDVEEELASSDEAEPRSQDADEESLEEAAEDDTSDEEELADEAAAKQEEMKNKILGGR